MAIFRKKKGSALRALAWYSGGSMSVPITKFSLRMYGSKKAVEKEQERHSNAGAFVIHPYSNFRFYWDFVTLILLIVSMLIIPIAITFFNDEMTTDKGWIIFNLFMDFWFLVDIVMNFHTGIIVECGESEVILDLPTIRSRYLRSWFAVDLVSTLPVDYILQMTSGGSASVSASRAMKLFRFAKIISLLRLLRISRLIRYVHQWEQIVGMQYDLAVAAVRIFNLVCLMLLIGHWSGCLQFLIPLLYGFPEKSWIVVDNLLDKPWPEQYSWCLFKAMSHMLCIGYGQQPPQNLMDLWMTMLSMVSGAVCFAMFIGHATALVQSMDSSKRQYKEKYMQVKEYMRFRRLPKEMRSRVYSYYENRYQGKMFDEQGILNELSTNLREEVVNFNCRHLVASVPFFSNADHEFVTQVVQRLKYEFFQTGDIIVREGEVGKKMYFIQHGVVEVRNSHRDDPIKQLSDGSFFGEICLLINDRRVASVVAVSYCSTYSLHVEDFNNILSDHPIMRETLERVAAARLSSIGRSNTELDARVRSFSGLRTESTKIMNKIVDHDQRTSEASLKAKLYTKQPYIERLSKESNIKKSKSVGADMDSMTAATPSQPRKHLLRINSLKLSPKRKPSCTEAIVSEGENDPLRLFQANFSKRQHSTDSRKSKVGLFKKKFRKPRSLSALIGQRSKTKYFATSLNVEEDHHETILQSQACASSLPNGIAQSEHPRKGSDISLKTVPTVVVVDVEPFPNDLESNTKQDVGACGCSRDDELDEVFRTDRKTRECNGMQQAAVELPSDHVRVIQETGSRLPALEEGSADDCV